MISKWPVIIFPPIAYAVDGVRSRDPVFGKIQDKDRRLNAGLHQTARTDPVHGMLERSVVGEPDESKWIASTELSRLK